MRLLRKHAVRPSVLRIVALVSGLSALHSHPVVAQIYNVQEMNTDRIVALDRTKTVVLIPVGNLEEHGPYLPWYTDGYQAEYLARRLASAIAPRPGWSVLNFPPVRLGVGSAENFGGNYTSPAHTM